MVSESSNSLFSALCNTVKCDNECFISSSKKNAQELKNWLSEKEIWGEADMKIPVRNSDDLANAKKRILEWSINNRVYHGVYIIMKTDGSGHASLWIGHEEDTIDKNNHINGAYTIYFWGLKRAQYDFDEMAGILRAIKTTNMNQAAIKGFKVINELSREIPRAEYCATIYFANNRYRLDGLNTDGSPNTVNPIDDWDVFFEGVAPIRDNMGEIININQLVNSIKAYIHTHVIDEVGQDGARFFSARDFYGSYHRLVPIYMKHININDRIFRADPIKITDAFVATFRTYCNSRNPSLNPDNPNFTEQDDGCVNRRNCPASNCPRYNANNCLFGIFRRHRQKVFIINFQTGVEAPLW